MAESAPRRSYLIVVLVVLAVLVVVIAKTNAKHKAGPKPQSQTAQLAAESPVAKIAAAVPADSTKVGAPEPATATEPPAANESEATAKPSAPSAADPNPEPPAQPAAELPTPQEPAKEVDLIPGSKLAECLKNGRPTFVDFGAGWCKPCQLQDPVLRQTAAKYEGKLDVVFVDTDEYPEIAKQYRVSAIPAQFVFDAKGAQVATHIGFWPATEIDQALATAGVEK